MKVFRKDLNFENYTNLIIYFHKLISTYLIFFGISLEKIIFQNFEMQSNNCFSIVRIKYLCRKGKNF
jgi:hypothetical protein